MKKIAAIILNYNSSHDCEKCVCCLSGQTYQNLQIIIVDNNSTAAGERQRLEEIAGKYDAKLICNNDNRGFSAGNNVGIKWAVAHNNDWAIVINPDVEIGNPEYIATMMKMIDHYPDTVVAASRMILPNGKRQNPEREISYSEELLWIIEGYKQSKGISNGYLQADKTGYCEKVSGCCFFIDLPFLKSVGYLDESVFMYCEEPILAKIVKKAGKNELYVSEVEAKHNHYAVQKGNTKARMQKVIRSRIYYLKKYSGYKGVALLLLLLSKYLQLVFWKLYPEKSNKGERT